MISQWAAVLGKPIAHSLSPTIHNAGYVAAGLTGWRYTAIECAEAELADLVAGLGPEWAGLSLTMPLKEAALAVADDVSPLAQTLSAANTFVRRSDGSWWADNTDAGGVADALRPWVTPESTVDNRRPVSVAVLGAGGTARAALAAAAQLGARQVRVYARRAAAVDAMRPIAAATGLEVSYVDWSAVASAGEADVVISTVPAGVADPHAATVHWGQSTVLLDALYHPWPTPLAASASRAGCQVVGGQEMLLAQAVRQFALFTGVDPPIDAMRTALLSA